MNQLKHTIFLITLIIACPLLLVACASSPEEIAPATPLKVEFTNWWGDFTLIIAQQQGLFEKYGVEVQPVFYEVPAHALPDFAAGEVDGGLFTIGEAINLSKHTNLKVVAVQDNGSFNTVVSIPEITNIEFLEGKRIGVQIGTSYELLISEMLKSADLGITDVTLVNMSPEDVPANLGKTIDAGFVYEPYTTDALSLGNSLLLRNSEFIGLYPKVIVFQGEIAKTRADDIRAFLKAWFEAVEFRKQNPEETRQIIADYFQTSVNEIEPDRILEIMTLENNYELFQTSAGARQTIRQTASLNADYLIQMGVLSTNPNFEDLLDSTFLP